MLTRTFLWTVPLFWLVSMTWLVRHDILPAWTAQEVPRFRSGVWLTDALLATQTRVENKFGQRIGTTWTVHTPSASGLSRLDVIYLERFMGVARLRIAVTSDFDTAGVLDAIHLELHGPPESVRLDGERFSGHLALELQIGRRPTTLLKVDAGAVGVVADIFKPFPAMPTLEVGQSWRLNTLNPVAAVTGFGSELITTLVRVTGRTRLMTAQGPVDCFVVETEHATAWVQPDGVVVRQTVNLPVGGEISLFAEPFDREALHRVQALTMGPDR